MLEAVDLAAHPHAVAEAATELVVDRLGQFAHRVGGLAAVVQFGVVEFESRL